MSHENREWLHDLTDLMARDVPCVLITVMEAKGSTPREAGTKMVVTEDEQFGTIGGGNLEYQAIEQARTLLQNICTKVERKDFPLGPTLAQCCGGSVSILLEPFIKNNKTVLLFGAGHVGKEVVKVLEGLPVKIKWVDERPHEFPDTIPSNTEKIVTSAPVAEIRGSDENCYILIMTHSHDLDYKLTKAALEHRNFSYLGLIGSKTKHVKFEKRLIAEGIAKTDLSRLTCPIGIGGVTGKHPREIAISVAAELLQLGLTHQGMKEEENAKVAHIS